MLGDYQVVVGHHILNFILMKIGVWKDLMIVMESRVTYFSIYMVVYQSGEQWRNGQTNVRNG